MPSDLPPEKIHGSNAAWNANVVLNRIKFVDFKALTKLGMANQAF